MKKLFISIMSVLMLHACTNLESEVYDKINPGIFPTNEQDADALLSNVNSSVVN